MTTIQSPVDRSAVRAYNAAWWSLATFPVVFAAAVLVGEGLISALGYDGGDPPFWAMVVAGAPALALLAAPALASLFFSRRARALGHPRAMTPAKVGLLVSGGFVLLNLVQGALVLLFD